VIVIIGIPVRRRDASGSQLAGSPALAALAAARTGERVELVGKTGDDPAGDDVVLALTQAGVGHAALLRDPARVTPQIGGDADDADLLADGNEDQRLTDAARDRSGWPALEPEDVELALRYLPDVRTIVVAEAVNGGVLRVAADAARYAGARLVVAASTPEAVPGADLVLAPPRDDDGASGGLLGELAAALERGADVEDAFTQVRARLGVEPSSS
jgi:hypothetical protein